VLLKASLKHSRFFYIRFFFQFRQKFMPPPPPPPLASQYVREQYFSLARQITLYKAKGSCVICVFKILLKTPNAKDALHDYVTEIQTNNHTTLVNYIRTYIVLAYNV
jgi:hypothetical protein